MLEFFPSPFLFPKMVSGYMGVGRRVPWSWFGVGGRTPLISLMMPMVYSGLSLGKFTGTCHAGNKMTPTESMPASKLTTHAPSAVFQSIGGSFWIASIPHMSWERFWGAKHRPFLFGEATTEVSSQGTTVPPFPRRHQGTCLPIGSPTTLFLFLPTEKFLRERGGPSIFFSPLEWASSKSYLFFLEQLASQLSWSVRKCVLSTYRKSTSIPALCFRPGSSCVNWS